MYMVKDDGKTPHERLFKRPDRGEVAEFGECVHRRLCDEDRGKADNKWQLGLWLGKTLKSDEHMVGTASGVFPTRSIWRRPDHRRFEKGWLDQFRGSPSEPVPA